MKALFTLISFWLCFQVLAQPNSLYFKNYAEREGLSNNIVRRLLNDSNGYLWLSTPDGLNRFDGYDFKTFRNDPSNPCSISNNYIFALYEDSKGNIWVGTQQELNKFDPRTGCFTKYLDSSVRSPNLSSNMVTDIVEDDKGFIWVSTNGSGIGKLDPGSGEFTQFAYPWNTDLTEGHNSVISLEISSKGQLLIGYSGAGFSIMDMQKETFEHFSFDHPIERDQVFRHNVIRDIYEDKEGGFWLATYKGLIHYDSEAKKYDIYLHDENDKHSLPNNSVHDIEFANDTAIWLVTFGGGLSYFDINKKKFYNYNESNKGINLKNHSFFNVKLIGDKLWIGASVYGLYSASLSEKNSTFLSSSFFFPNEEDPSFPITFSNGLYPNFLMSFANRDLVSYNVETNTPSSPNHLKKLNSQLRDVKKSYITWQGENRIWIGTYKNGLYRYNIEQEELRHYSYKEEIGSLTHPNINHLMVDNQNRLWVGTVAGLNLFIEERDYFENWRVEPSREDGLKNEYISTMYNDSKGNVWIGTEKGLYRFNEITKGFQSYFHSDSLHESLSDNQINSIVEDDLGNLWVGTQNGISKMTYNGGAYSVSRFEPKRPLENSVINGLTYVKPYLWAATGKGVAKIDTRNGHATYYTWERLESNTFTGGTKIQNTSKLLFFNRDAIVIFDPEELEVQIDDINIIFNDIKIFNKSITQTDRKIEVYPKGAVTYLEKIVLPYSASYLSFEFTAIDINHPERLSYAYRLNGFQDNWIVAGKRHFAAYSNLDPGEYTFEVKVTNELGNWKGKTKALLVVIEPPFWRTWWFTIIIVLLFLGILYGLHRFRLEKALEVERLRVRIASDLHDDIGATLTKISLYADLLNTGKQIPSERNQLLQKIANMGRDTLRNLSDIVWAIDARNDSLGNLINKIQEFAVDMLTKKDIEVIFMKEGIDMDESISAEKRQHVYLICKEAINNIFKHAEASKVRISFIAKNHKIDISIHDNGNGLLRNKKNELGNGLRNIEQRAKKLDADLHLKEENGLSIKLQGIDL